MKKYLYLSATLAMVAVACTNDPVAEGGLTPSGSDDTTNSGLTTVQLASFPASQSRIVVEQTRADEVDGTENETPVVTAKKGSLELLATIDNLSTEEGRFPGFTKEGADGRYLSATCVYFDGTTYYTTYHMQGNNYNTMQEDETSGYIETFTLTTNEQGQVTPVAGTVYYSADPDVDFDFNHLYFDDLNSLWGGGVTENPNPRIVAVGHRAVHSSKAGAKDDTYAVIGKLVLDGETPDFQYARVRTNDKIYDTAGRVIDRVDAGDVNCVLRTGNYYYLATRKGIAVLNASDDDKLFTPIHNMVDNVADENSIYFVKTPGSAKHLAHIGDDSHFSLLYLTESPVLAANAESPANVINFSMSQGDGTLCGSNTSDSKNGGPGILDATMMNPTEEGVYPIVNWSPNVNQYTIGTNVCPVDGKNVLAQANNGSLLAACLGKNGLYVYNRDVHKTEVVKFSDVKEPVTSRPVNGVFVEDYMNLDGGRVHDGFIYVANGACLTIIDAATLETVADYSAFDKTAEVNLASANYVHVAKAATATNVTTEDRIVTVAFGQAGVKVFKFVPPVKK